MNMDLAFVDVETTGLNPQIHKMWSIGIITGDAEYYSEFPVELDKYTDLGALKISRYVETLADDERPSDSRQWIRTASKVKVLLKGKTLVGAAVHFDAAFIKSFLDDLWYARLEDNLLSVHSDHPPKEPWHYKLLDVCTLTMGTLGLDYIPSLSKCCELLDIEVDKEQQHNALYDAKLAKTVYEYCRVT